MSRVGDREREHATAALRRHFAEGRLDDLELSDRIELVLHARSRWELAYALRGMPRVERAVQQVRHGLVVAAMGAVWLTVTVALLVAFAAWIVANGVSLAALVVFPLVWVVLSALLYRRTAQSRRRLHP